MIGPWLMRTTRLKTGDDFSGGGVMKSSGSPLPGSPPQAMISISIGVSNFQSSVTIGGTRSFSNDFAISSRTSPARLMGLTNALT